MSEHIDRTSNIGKKASYEPLNLQFYAEEVLQSFLISVNVPLTLQEKEKISKITKQLSLLIWAYKAQILPKKDEIKITNLVVDLHNSAKHDDIDEKSSLILQQIRNITPKIDILEHFYEIEQKACNENHYLETEKLQEKFNDIIKHLSSISDDFSIMKLNRAIKEIKINYFDNPNESDKLLYNLENVIHQ